MIISFSATNFLSLRDMAEINLCATPLRELQDTLIPSGYTKHGLLPVIALFGANASGKSNILFALSFMRGVVVNSFGRTDVKAMTPYRPFGLDEQCKTYPSRFAINFILNEVRYEYGFSIEKEKIADEWLYSYPKKNKVILFTRENRVTQVFHFGRSLTGSNRQIESITRPTSLFLSAAKASGHPILSPIADFFQDGILVQRTPSALPDDQIAKILSQDEDLKRAAEQYLGIADTGILSIRLERLPVPEDMKSDISKFYKAISEFVGDSFDSVEVPSERYSIKLGHKSADGEVKYLNFNDESLGTRYLLSLLPGMISTLRSGNVLVLDEITTSLHTLLAKRLVAIFKDKNINRNGAQLIFTSHDTNLLAPGVLRRDEVWFAEKSEIGATSVFPLTDIKTKNTDNIERGYIQGRFGAIPFLPEVTSEDLGS